MPVTLRAQRTEDLPLLTGGASPFAEFGPVAPLPAALDADGGLAVLDDDRGLAGDVSWHWARQLRLRGAADPLPTAFVMRGSLWRGGAHRDCHLYSILRADVR